MSKRDKMLRFSHCVLHVKVAYRYGKTATKTEKPSVCHLLVNNLHRRVFKVRKITCNERTGTSLTCSQKNKYFHMFNSWSAFDS